MRTYMLGGRCVVCGSYRTKATFERYLIAVDKAVKAAKDTHKSLGPLVECCAVPAHIGLRDFATQYYGKVWYRNPLAPWSQGQLQTHFEEVMYIGKMYHLYRFSNYTDLKKYFADYDEGRILIGKITKDVLPAYRMRAIDPDSPQGGQRATEGFLEGLDCPVEVEVRARQKAVNWCYLGSGILS